jgi:cobalt/nickel transport system ATP-binding protein
VPDTPAFELDRVAFSYEDTGLALRDISLTIARGERVAVLGANGSGKSTLLRILDGLIFPAAGGVRACGEAVNEETLRDAGVAERFRRRVGLVFQNADVQLFSTTVREEIAFGPLQLGLDREEVVSRTADVAAMLGLDGLLERPPFRLSGGEKKKVAIATVLVVNPEIILLDEPTAGLDPRTQGWLLELLAELHHAGKTLVSATNELDLVPAFADRVVVLDELHAVAADGPVAMILADGDLLRRVNIIHEHAHRHGETWHVHSHFHGGEHEHEH